MENNAELEKIISYVQKLEKRLKQLESKEAITVEKFLEIQQPKPLQISVDKLIELYNDIPHILTEYAVEVSLNAKSYRQQLDKTMILEQVIRGNYWVILLENLEEKNYYLLPHGNKKIKIYKQKSIDYLFTIQGKKDINNEEFYLIKPCGLTILPSGKEWLIQEKGELSIERNSVTQQIASELAELSKNQEKIPTILEDFLNVLTKINQGNTQLSQEIKLLDNRLQKLEPSYMKLINLYTENPAKFAQLEGGCTKLKFTQDTINLFLQNRPETITITLEVDNLGHYLLKHFDREEYLFPDPKVLFDKMALTLAHYTKLFIVTNEIPIAIMGKDIVINKPAKLRKNGNIWTLIESGEICF
ncbi:hypothetical protein ACN4EE_03060 [Geminocystis sp. CENA526]|uniref:hypothetical protein n=1 Tax=Geminocystis sp. CENA526 TaxID=1355871 RepID=UPI003D6F08E3